MNEMLDGAIKILNTLELNGFKAYMVGGYVRDYLLNNQGKDIDITTNARPSEVERLFLDTFNKSLKFKTVSVRLNGFEYEVTTFRVDKKYKDHRHPTTKVSCSLKKDVKRRDFTINSICMDKNLQIIDYKNGINDLNNKIVRTVGNPKKRFKEDALRMFRAFRFASRYNFEIEPKTFKGIVKYSYLVKFVSKERIKDEMTKIVKEEYFKELLPVMLDSKILICLPKIEKAMYVLKNNYHSIDLLCLLALASYLNNNEIIDEVLLSKKETKDIKQILDYVNMLQKRDVEREMLFGLNIENLQYAFIISSILNNIPYTYDEVLTMYENLKVKSVKEIDINGSDIKKALHLEDSPIIKDYLHNITKAVLDGTVENDKNEIKKYLDRMNKKENE